MSLPEVAIWVHEMSGHGSTVTNQRWPKFIHIPFVLSEPQNVNKTCSVCQQERQRLHTAPGQILLGEGLHTADSWTDATTP